MVRELRIFFLNPEYSLHTWLQVQVILLPQTHRFDSCLSLRIFEFTNSFFGGFVGKKEDAH